MNRKIQGTVLTALLAVSTLVVAPAAQADGPRTQRAGSGTSALLATNSTVSSTTTLRVVGNGGPRATVQTARTARVTVKHTSLKVRAGESIRIVVNGRAASGTPLGKKNARLQYRANSSKKWKTLGNQTTNSKGKATLYWRATSSGDYRIAITPASGKAAVLSKTMKVTVSKANRTLAQRAKVAKNELGKPLQATKKLSAKARKSASSSAKSVRYRNYKSATVVEVSKGSRVNTWIVRGKINTLYRKAGGATGTYGVPVRDAKCGLLEGGCVQQFTKGTIYSSNYKKAATGVKIRGIKGEIAAAAQSQVGYRKKYRGDASVQHTKYNKWSGRTHAWCAMFVFWAADASGNRSVIPPIYRIPSQESWVKKNWKTSKNSPKVGDLAFIDSRGYGRATHIAYVVAVKDGWVTTIEGNTASSFPAGHRGVSKGKRHVSRVMYFGTPNWGA